MKLNRRDFLTVSAVTGLAGTLSPISAQAFTLPDPPQKARLRLSCQEGVAPGQSLTEKLDFLEANGFEGFEPGGGGLNKRIDELKQALQGRKIRISAICAGFKGVLISEQEDVRKTAMESMKEILTAAGALGSTGMIMVPAFNGQTKLGHQESRELLVDKLLPELSEHAHQAGTRVLLEPLNRRECHFMRQVADAAAICRDVNNPGLAVMGDFWHMTWEETSDLAAFIAAGKYLHHVHIASRKTRKMPGEETDNYIEGFRGLKAIGYQDFISLECGSIGDRAKTIPAAAKLIREQWEMA